mmetsp:Transcript_35332/g.79711  ORF Transcript_35332/g.79711 Transcript_35332/m.79711 type:complete len:217 (+) Transcript_35332:51-701(+)
MGASAPCGTECRTSCTKTKCVTLRMLDSGRLFLRKRRRPKRPRTREGQGARLVEAVTRWWPRRTFHQAPRAKTKRVCRRRRLWSRFRDLTWEKSTHKTLKKAVSPKRIPRMTNPTWLQTQTAAAMSRLKTRPLTKQMGSENWELRRTSASSSLSFFAKGMLVNANYIPSSRMAGLLMRARYIAIRELGPGCQNNEQARSSYIMIAEFGSLLLNSTS